METSVTKRIAKNFAWLTVGEIASKGINLFKVIYIARVLGVASFGLFNFAQAFLVYLALLVDSGFSVLGAREISKERARAGAISINIFSIRLLLACLAFVISLFIVLIIPLSREMYFLFIGTFLFVFYHALNTDWVFQGLEKMEQIAFSRILFSFFSFIMIFILVKNAGDLVKIPIIQFLVGLIISLFFLYILFKWFAKASARHLTPSNWWNSFQEAMPLGASAILIQVYYNIDSIMLGFMGPIINVGYYNAAYKLVYALLVIPTVLGASIYPILSRLHLSSLEEMKRLVVLISKITFFLGMPVVVGGAILSYPIILMFFGKGYQPSGLAFQILIWSFLTVLTNVPFAFSLLASRQDKQYFYSVAAGAILNLLLNIYFIPRYGFLGAALTTLISEVAVWALLYYFFVRNVFYVSIHYNILSFGSCAALMGVFLITLKANLLVSIILGAIIYLMFCLIVRAITLKEMLKMISIGKG